METLAVSLALFLSFLLDECEQLIGSENLVPLLGFLAVVIGVFVLSKLSDWWHGTDSSEEGFGAEENIYLSKVPGKF